MRLCAIVGLLAVLLSGCADSEDNDATSGSAGVPIAAGTLSGVVGGTPWTLVTGQTDAFLSEGQADYFAELYPVTVEACTIPMNLDQHRMILSVPRAPGDYPMNLGLNATFVLVTADGDFDNRVTTKGHIQVDEITDTVIRGGAYAELDASNRVNGHFELAICAD